VNKIKRILIPWESPELVAHKLIQEWGEAGFIWLDGDGSDLGRWVTLGINPLEQFCSRGLEKAQTPTKKKQIIKRKNLHGFFILNSAMF